MDSTLTVKECKKFWGFSESWIYRHWHELGGFKIGTRIKFDIEDQEKLKKTFKKNFQKRLTTPFLFNTLRAGGNKMATSKKGRRNYGYGFGSVYKRKKGKSLTVDHYEDGYRIQKTLPPHIQNEKEAHLYLRRRKAEVLNRKYGIFSRQKKIGFKTFALSSFHEDYMMTSRRNFQSDVYRLNILCDYFKDADLRSITPRWFRRFLKEMLKKGNAKSTCNRYRALTHRIFNVAIEEGYAEENPITKVKLYSEKDTLKERVLTEEEERKFYEASADYLKPIITIALNTGMRKGEILNLQWIQVDFKNRTIRVEKTKSEKIRYVPMNDAVFNKLSRLKVGFHGNQLVFFNPETGKPYVDLKRQFRNACRKADIKGLRFHDLRHTFATRLREKGVALEVVRDLLGHSSITTTQRYSHLNDERKRKAVELLDRKDKVSDNLVTIQNQSKTVN